MTIVLAATLPALASAKEPLYVAPELEVAPDVKISEGFSDCPFRKTFGEMLKLALHKENGAIAPGKVPTPAGRSLHVRLVGMSLSGNGFLGHDAQLRFEGALYQDGNKVAAFTDNVRFQTDAMVTACAQLRSNLDAEAIQIAKWARKPVDGQELKRWGE
ncbi:hypothetical protein [Cognatilysobacter bugurensis]|uniref:Uncharacterized protein n=1 Tax=Cognatilysobacter bugurensis TaxID=543356 RepID=A0A918SYN3_9GAMM|nr:hypothetical protein [Lysobacter bugurensis]GHA78893.1 hypothetical protein GCM10007067_15390 [Lysobacter bugurensis]